MKKPYQIEVINHHQDLVILPKAFNEPNLDKITFGTISTKANFKQSNLEKNKLIISRPIAHKLKIPDFVDHLHLFVHDQTLLIGPLVGIFTSGISPFPMRPIGERTFFFSKLLSVNNAVGACAFVFGEQQINWEQGTISGLFYHKDGWEKIEVPFPNVIYDRLPNRRSERRKDFQRIKNQLQNQYLIPWYNPGFFNKLEVYERLIDDENVKNYLPETHPFISFDLIERMLSKYGHVFMKPKNGSLGLGVHQILYDKAEGNYYCRYREQDQNKLKKFSTLESLINHVFQNRRLENMLVQQGIHLMRSDNRTIDFRVHTNKNELGLWEVTAIAAKVAGLGSVTTHINSGGVVKTIEEIFPTKEEQTEVIKKLTNAALLLSKAIENHLEGIIGEIGFDMGIDRSGHVWFFEANSKPGRSIFKHPQLKEFDLLTRKLSLAFAIFLTEKMIDDPEGLLK